MKLDHIVLPTRRLDHLADIFEQLGFLLTPVGEHGSRFGTANRCVMFEDHYIELLGVLTEPTESSRFRSALLADGAAVSMAALRSDDIDATHGDLQSRHISTQPPLHFSREMQAEGAITGRVEFAVVMPLLPPSARPAPFFCQQKTRERVFVPRWREHPNRATCLRWVEIEVHDPEATAAAYSSIGAQIVHEGDRRIVIQDGPRVVLVPLGNIPRGADSTNSERATMLHFFVPDLNALRFTLDMRKARYRVTGDSVVADCSDRWPCVLSFTAGGRS